MATGRAPLQRLYVWQAEAVSELEQREPPGIVEAVAGDEQGSRSRDSRCRLADEQAAVAPGRLGVRHSAHGFGHAAVLVALKDLVGLSPQEVL